MNSIAPLPTSIRLARVSAILAGYAIAGSSLTLVGLAFDIHRLADWDLDGIAQRANNAIGLIAVAAALILANARRTGPARWLAGFAGALGGATLFEHATGIDLGIDTLVLHREWGQGATTAPGRMGVPGSFSLLIIAASVILLTTGRRRAAAAGGSLTIFVAMLSVIGYAFGADMLYAIPRFTAIALQTSTMLLAMGLALVASVPEHAPMRLIAGESSASLLFRRVLPAVVLLPILVGWLRLRGESAGLYDNAFGTALVVVTLITLLAGVVWWCGKAIAVHEDALRRNHDRLAAILGSISDAFLTVDAAWRITFTNREADELLGFAGREQHEAMLWEIPPFDETGDAERLLRRAMAEGIASEFESTHLSKNRWHLVRCYPKRNGGLAIHIRDITDRKDAELALRRSEEKFSLLFSKAPVAAALATTEGILVDVNQAFADLFGREREELIDSTASQAGIGEAEFLGMLASAARGESAADLEMTLRQSSGREIVVLGSATAVEIEGKTHALATLKDITDRKAAEQALKQSAKALVAADRMKDEFLATLSHELRTPVTAIVGWSQLLAGGGLDAREQQVGLEAIRASARAQAQLIEDVLDVSRIVTGNLRLQRRMSDLREVVHAAVSAIRPAAEGRGIELQLAIDPHPEQLFIDPDRVQQVIWNLLSNAIKFSPLRTTVGVGVRTDGTSAIVEVTDQGPGIPKTFLPHLFERFRQADSSPSRLQSGLGIGLALAKDLIELHGGTIDVHTEEGRGSRFTVRLPLTGAVEAAPSAQAVTNAPATLEGIRVLYVDDRDDARLLISTMLKKQGAEVLEAASVDHALTVLSSAPPEVVLTDLAMPVRDGFDLLATLRDDDRWKHLPVLALTAQAHSGDAARAESAGFGAFLRKPVDAGELASAVARAVWSKRRKDGERSAE